MKIRPAMKVLHGNPAREYYVVEVKDDSALLIRTNSKLQNDGSFYQQYEDGRDKPYYPYWSGLDALYISYESISPSSDDEKEANDA